MKTDLLFLVSDNATQSIPCEKIKCWGCSPTVFKDWPCDLLVVIAKQGCMGNCFRWNWNGSIVSEDWSVMRGIMCRSPAYGPTATSTLTFFPQLITKHLIPFISVGVCNNRRSITGIPTSSACVVASQKFQWSLGIQLDITLFDLLGQRYLWQCMCKTGLGVSRPAVC